MNVLLMQVITAVALFAPPDRKTYVETLEEVEVAIDRGNQDPQQAIDLLEEALDSMAGFQLDLIGDRRALDLRAVAQLSLARAYLLEGREREALGTVDILILDTQESAPPVKNYGPTIQSLYDERVKVLEGYGTSNIEINCTVPCRVYVQERLGSQSPGPLLLGDYRIVVEAVDASIPPLRAQILLSEPGQVGHLTYGYAPIQDADSGPQKDTAPKRRMLPRWVEISGVVIGAGLAVTGGVLLAYHNQCPGGLDPVTNADECPRLYNNLASGIATAAVGGAALLGFGVALTVDEVRGSRARELTTMLTWSVPF
jgi:hypothetical protein